MVTSYINIMCPAKVCWNVFFKIILSILSVADLTLIRWTYMHINNNSHYITLTNVHITITLHYITSSWAAASSPFPNVHITLYMTSSWAPA